GRGAGGGAPRARPQRVPRQGDVLAGVVGEGVHRCWGLSPCSECTSASPPAGRLLPPLFPEKPQRAPSGASTPGCPLALRGIVAYFAASFLVGYGAGPPCRALIPICHAYIATRPLGRLGPAPSPLWEHRARTPSAEP